MEAVILSGGLGTRLRPLTYTRPKPLLPVANKPMVEHILDRLPPEVDRAVLASGYMVEDIRAWARDREHRVELTVIDEQEPLGTGGAIKNVESELTGDFLCFNGDVLSTAPLQHMVDTRRETDAMGVLSLWRVDDPSHFGVVDLHGERIARFVEKPDRDEAPSNLINAGTYCFAHDVLDHIAPDRKVSLEHEVFPALIDAGHDLLGQPFEGHWVDCGRPEVYLEAHRLLLDGRLERGEEAQMDGDWEGWACLGPASHVQAGALMARSVTLAGATVKSGARIQGSVIGADATVGKDARLVDCVVGDGETIEAGAELVGERVGLAPEHGGGA